MTQPYNIVGRQIEFGDAWYLHGEDTNGDDIITKDVSINGQEGEPLTVEYVGRTMVDLSSKPVRKGDTVSLGELSYDRIIRRIKHCLTVVSLVPASISKDKLDAIWEKLEIELDYDTRAPQADDVDLNKRIFIVPAQDALKDKADTFANSVQTGFLPPLTYSLDRNVMANFFATRIEQIIDQVAAANPTVTIADIKDDLKEAINDGLSVTQITGVGGTPLDAKKDEILTKPVAAFYRAVGVYLTQMCD